VGLDGFAKLVEMAQQDSAGDSLQDFSRTGIARAPSVGAFAQRQPLFNIP